MDIENTEDQTITDALSAAYDQIEAGQTAPEPEVLEIDTAPDPVIDTPADSADNPEQNPGPEDGALENPDGEQPQGKEQADQPIEATQEDHAPSSWKTDIAQKWSELPVEVRAEIKRRETDYHKGIEQYKQAANIGHAIEKVVTPHLQTFQQLGVDPITAINSLLSADQRLRYGSPEQKAEYLSVIAQEYGIALETVKPRPPLDPAMMELQRQNQQLQQYQRGIEQRDTQVALTEIDRFASDPKNTHFNDVRDDMVLLLQSSRATSLQDAYEKAVWMRPDIRKSLVEQQRTEAEQKATIQAREKRAKAAAVGIKGSGLSKGGAINPNASLRETIAAAMDGNA